MGNEFFPGDDARLLIPRVHAAFTIGLLATSAEAAPRLRSAVRTRAALREFAEPSELLEAVATRAVDLSILELRGHRTPDALRALRRLTEAFPSHPVIAWCDFRTLDAGTLLAVARHNVADLLRGDTDDLPHALGRAIGAAMQRTVAAGIVAAVGDVVPSRLRPVFEYALEHVNDALDRDQLAATFGISRRTLHNRLVEAALPPTRSFITWCRLFVAVALLEQPGHTLDSVAGQLDFSDGSGLSNLLRRYTGSGINGLRRQGALASTVHAFRQQVRERERHERAARDRDAGEPAERDAGGRTGSAEGIVIADVNAADATARATASSADAAPHAQPQASAVPLPPVAPGVAPGVARTLGAVAAFRS